ncbi:MAG: acyltransferase [Acidimicrobiales bacterium]
MAPGSFIAADLVAGDYAFVGPGCTVQSGVELGRYTMLASGASIVGADHPIDVVGTPMTFAGRDTLKRTVIGEDVWIGQNAIVMVGVTIGDYAIVAAGSVVTHDVPEGQIVAVSLRKVLRPLCVRGRPRSSPCCIEDQDIRPNVRQSSYAWS